MPNGCGMDRRVNHFKREEGSCTTKIPPPDNNNNKTITGV